MTIESDSLLVRVIDGFDHERDASVTLSYRCRDVTGHDDVTCRARVVISDVNDEWPQIRFINSSTAQYDRLQPIDITGPVPYTPSIS